MLAINDRTNLHIINQTCIVHAVRVYIFSTTPPELARYSVLLVIVGKIGAGRQLMHYTSGLLMDFTAVFLKVTNVQMVSFPKLVVSK